MLLPGDGPDPSTSHKTRSPSLCLKHRITAGHSAGARSSPRVPNVLTRVVDEHQLFTDGLQHLAHGEGLSEVQIFCVSMCFNVFVVFQVVVTRSFSSCCEGVLIFPLRSPEVTLLRCVGLLACCTMLR